MRSHVEQEIAGLAARQHGVVTRAQLLELGLTSGTIASRVRTRRLRVVHRGVYIPGSLVGALIPTRAREMAAVLACGPGAVLSHGSAASLRGLLPPAGPAEPVHVTVPGADRGRRRGIRSHRVPGLAATDIEVVEGIPTTTVPRTLVDVAGVVDQRQLEQALAVAEREGLVTLEEVLHRARAAGPRRGIGTLRALAGGPERPALTRSKAEERLLALLRRGGLPPPEVNHRIGGYEVDFYWPEGTLAVEVDGFAWHRSRGAFERDRRRDAELSILGIRVLRVTWEQITDEPEAVLVRIARLLPTPPRPIGRGGGV